MKHLIYISTAILGLGTSSMATDPIKIEGVSQTAIQNAFQILRSDYIRSRELDFDELNRAALQGLLQRLYLGASLTRKADAKRPVIASGLISDRITPEIGYLRPQSYSADEVSQLRSKLRELNNAHVPHLIFDLRSAAAPGEFNVASSMLECFIPEGQVIFKLKQVGREDSQLFVSHGSQLWHHPLLVLVDEDTNNLGETIAAVLRQRKQALILGSRTRGGTVRYETQPLDEEWQLRFARAEMLLVDDTSLFQTGLPADFQIDMPLSAKRLLFTSMTAHPLRQTIFDQPRPRYNEAALVARKNPELEDYIRRSTGGTEANVTTTLQDAVLQRAVDILLTRIHLESAGLSWDITSTEPTPTIRKATKAP